jgi:hypothetical protein
MKRLATLGSPRKGLAALAMVFVALGAGVTSAEAANGGPTVTTSPKEFDLAWTACRFLPTGTTVHGVGTERSITAVTTRNGVTTIVNVTHTRGTATDQSSNTYVFNYNNEFRISNTVADPNTYSGLMFDTFSLSGHGPARLHNGFVAEVTTTNFTGFSFHPLHAFGDPIDFATGAALCDPL